MNAQLPVKHISNIPSLAMDEGELIEVLANSLYPGAKIGSMKLVIGYCKAQQLDPLQKPVHIVPMKVKTGEKDGYGNDKYAMRDVVMPGIGLYRTQAVRTGQYAGVTAPEFGPTKTITFKESYWTDGDNDKRVKKWRDAEIEYPEWCTVTVKRIVGGNIVEFTATEYWSENYATAGNDTHAPNAMWKKRPRGQIAKCAEAQALRKAFPEFGATPTAEEMEGKAFEVDGYTIDNESGEVTGNKSTGIQMPASKSKATAQQSAPPTSPPDETATATDQPPASAAPGSTEKSDGPKLSPGQLKTIRATLKRSEGDESTLCTVLGVTTLEELPMARVNEAILKASGK